VVPSDFNNKNLDGYAEIIFQADVNEKANKGLMNTIDSILEFKETFFSVPFKSKIMYRSTSSFWPRAGSHLLHGASEDYPINDDLAFVAHLPFTSMENLIRRADHGKEIREAGYPRTYSWQSQIVDLARASRQLDKFWSNHSVSTEEPDFLESSFPKVFVDKKLSVTLMSAVKDYKEILQSGDNSVSSESYYDIESISVSTTMNLINQMRLQRDLMISENGLQIRALISENLALQKEIANNKQDIKAIHASFSWKLTRLIREIHKRIKKTKR
jgi:hypothetical protein